jgi:tetratricopeptide (TPR) repeat protein
MKIKLICALGSLWLATPLLLAQNTIAEPLAAVPTVAEAQAEMDRFQTSALNSELFYQLLVGELTAQDGGPAAGFALLLDAARKSNDAQLYQRATDIALQSRSGDAALQAATAWKQAQPASREANRYILQILIALNRISATVEPLKTEIEMAPATERTQVMAAIPRAFARVTDKKLAASVVEDAVTSYLAGSTNQALASAAWTTVARMRLAATDASGAVEAIMRAQMADPRAEGPALVALELMDPKLPAAEVAVKAFITNNASSKVLPDVRMAYARGLLDAQRYSEASTQLQIALREKPDFSSAWLVLGSLQLQDNQLAPAQASLERYVALASNQTTEDEQTRGLAQAYLSLAQIAEKRKDFAAAETWIAKIENSEDMMQAQVRRASILASQGKLAEGRQLIRSLPERSPADARLKLMAEIGLLRELKQYQLAYDLLGQAVIQLPTETELLYDRAMMAEKLGKLDEMESLLRQLIKAKPDYHSAYNALGYSFADRNMHLPEARELIRKALEFVPADPFIQDSLGWVEFRMGNKAEAAKILETAYKAKPDAEIAAHFGEVLWSMGQRDRAMAIWREGRMLSPDNETLMETLKRLQVKL